MKTLIFLLFLTSAAQAQEAYVPPDQDLWQQMSKAFSELNMPLLAHQQVQQIMQNVEAEAIKRHKAKAPEKK